MAEVEDASTSLLVMLLQGSALTLALVMKVPQIVTVVQKGTTQGISLTSLLMEFWVFTNLFAYPCAMGYPFFGYMEFLFLSIQDTVLLYLMFRERKQINISSVSTFVVYISIVVGLCYGYLPQNIHSTVVVCIAPISATSKIIQLTSILRSKSAGSVSRTTYMIASYTPLAKLITNYLTIGDLPLMLVSLQAALLNNCILLSTIYYGTSKTKKQQ